MEQHLKGEAIADIDDDGYAEIINLPSFNNNERVVVLDDPSIFVSTSIAIFGTKGIILFFPK